MSVADVVLCAVVAAMVVRLYEVERELYTRAEIAESDLRVAKLGKVIRARQRKAAVKEVGDHGGADHPAQ